MNWATGKDVTSTQKESYSFIDTPSTAAADVFNESCELYVAWFGDLLSTSGLNAERTFWDDFLQPLFNVPIVSGTAQLDMLTNGHSHANEPAHLQVLRVACSFAVQAFVDADNDINKAWNFATDAMYWIGFIKGAFLANKESVDLVEVGKAASAMAKKRHAEDYQLAKDAIDHWRENISPDLSAQKAATELTRVVPLSHKKLAELVSSEKKKVSRLRTPEPDRKA